MSFAIVVDRDTNMDSHNQPAWLIVSNCFCYAVPGTGVNTVQLRDDIDIILNSSNQKRRRNQPARPFQISLNPN